MSSHKYVPVPGRGLLTKSAIEYRMEYMEELGYELDAIAQSGIERTRIQKNIESLIGSVEIPTGLVGPLLFNHDLGSEDVFCAASTLEGALVASMNRGAKAISMSGGFTAKVFHQKMVRAPLFLLSSVKSAKHFESWLSDNFNAIKEVAEGYSNHATLLEVIVERDESNIYANFIYETGDAAGQNMTTTCTWHALLWLVDAYAEAGHEIIQDYVLEGNGSSDKKVSQYLMDHGRGIKVKAHAILKEEIIQKVLRTSSEQLLKFIGPSRKNAEKIGMQGYTINAANAIAAIFAATGQDLASIHESSVADFNLKKHPEGMEAEIILYSLVIGTLGGGTHLAKQQEALRLMNCAGAGKVERFASLIAGFTLGLDLSTNAAMVSGEFAKAHEKLGRNKPSDWLQAQEVDSAFISKIVQDSFPNIDSVQVLKGEVDNGILMNLSKRVNRKLIGFIAADLFIDGKQIPLLLKSKGTDVETVKGVHLMSASIDPSLSDLITKFYPKLEYVNTHLKELEIPAFIDRCQLSHIPHFFGNHIDEEREIYILAQERLLVEDLKLIDSENRPDQWDQSTILSAISAINDIHLAYSKANVSERPKLPEFDLLSAVELYDKLIGIIETEESGDKHIILRKYLRDLRQLSINSAMPKTLIHNDYNPRNIALRNNGGICIYDWELSVLNYPHRDIVELLSFTLSDDFDRDQLFSFLMYHFEISGFKDTLTWDDWKKHYILTLKEYLLSRVSFYCAAQVIMKLKFVDRVFANAVKMIEYLEEVERK